MDERADGCCLLSLLCKQRNYFGGQGADTFIKIKLAVRDDVAARVWIDSPVFKVPFSDWTPLHLFEHFGRTSAEFFDRSPRSGAVTMLRDTYWSRSIVTAPDRSENSAEVLQLYSAESDLNCR